MRAVQFRCRISQCAAARHPAEHPGRIRLEGKIRGARNKIAKQLARRRQRSDKIRLKRDFARNDKNERVGQRQQRNVEAAHVRSRFASLQRQSHDLHLVDARRVCDQSLQTRRRRLTRDKQVGIRVCSHKRAVGARDKRGRRSRFDLSNSPAFRVPPVGYRNRQCTTHFCTNPVRSIRELA